MRRLAPVSIICALAFGGCATESQSYPPPAQYAQSISELLLAQGYAPVSLRRVPAGLDILSVRINGVNGTFLLDTGASHSVINSRVLGRFGIGARDLRSSDTAIGAGGQVSLSLYTISGLTIGGRNFALSEISAADLTSITTAFASATGVQLDGIIGQDVMIKYDGVIDTKSQTLFLRGF